MNSRSFALTAMLTLVFGMAGTATAGDISRGEGISSTCIACHGPGGNSTMPAMYPSIAGRDADELAALLHGYRDGDIQDSQMAPQAAHLTDQDIEDLAAYFAAQEAK
ncbi:cytochrome c [Methylonatrum kenyense]|uniref:c-type cytochrome n=1 Tax=Methylonatrum kenyense TaxID=455253 RepID=UPI0020BE0F2C|nr:cytochrome c [Methylonatrum kenyense]MCK8515829.1 cytochrome c [Methylonatrum kenyense]